MVNKGIHLKIYNTNSTKLFLLLLLRKQKPIQISYLDIKYYCVLTSVRASKYMILRLEKAGLIEVTREGNKPNIYQLTTNEKLLREFSKLFSKGNKHD